MVIHVFYRCFIQVLFPLLALVLWVPVSGADLNPLIINALESDPRILSAQAEIQASQSQVDGSYAAYYPVIRANGTYGSVENEDPLQRDGDKRIYGLEIEQPLPFFGRESASIDIVKTDGRLKELELERVRQAVFAEVLEAAITLRAKLSTLRLRELMVDNLFSQAGHLKDSVAGGGAKLNEYYLAQSEWIQMQVLKAQAQAEHSAALEKLRGLAPGVTIDREFMAADPSTLDTSTLGLPTMPREFELALSDSWSRSPTLLLAGSALKKAQAEHAFAKMSVWPKLSLNYSIQRGTFGEATADTNSISVNLNVPLFEGGSSTAKMTTAMHRVESQREKLDQQRRLHSQQLQEIWSRWKSAIGMVEVLQTAKQQVQNIVGAIQVQLASGANTVLAELSARLILIETELNEIDQGVQRDQAFVQLLHQMGYLVLVEDSALPNS
jgi:outer membrane protein